VSRPRIAQADGQIGFHWVSPAGRPIALDDLVLEDEEPERLVPTHLEALDDSLIIAAGRFGELLGGGRAAQVGAERDHLHELYRVLDRLNREYARALAVTGLPVEIRGGQIIGTSALVATRARMALGIAGPTPFAGQLTDPRIGVVAGLGQFQWVSEDEPWRGGRWVVQSQDGPRYPLTLSMLLFDSSGVNKDAALVEHRTALSVLADLAAQPAGDGRLGADPIVLGGALEWLLLDWLMAHRESPDSAAIEIRKERIEDAAMIVTAAAALAGLRAGG
jgi:hypothetical protein